MAQPTVAISTDRSGPLDPRRWSGTPLNLARALERLGARVVPVGPTGGAVRWSLQALSSLSSRAGRRVNWEVEPAALTYLGRALDRQLRQAGPVDAVVTMGWYPRLRPDPDRPPVFYYGDAPMAARLDRSPFWSGIASRTRRLAVDGESRALASLDGAFLASRWAVDGVVATTGLPADRVRVVPFGANLDDPGEVRRTAPTTALRLLSVGVEWQRKGLDRTVLATDELRARGVDVHLDVVGADPPDASWERDHVTFHGFLDTSTDEGRSLRDRLYREADVFCLPTQYDPFCIVLTEAAAYGLPVVTTAVDGITERITDQGVLVEPDVTPAALADAVQRAVSSYDAMSAAARRSFLDGADWESCARLLLDHVAELGRRPR